MSTSVPPTWPQGLSAVLAEAVAAGRESNNYSSNNNNALQRNNSARLSRNNSARGDALLPVPVVGGGTGDGAPAESVGEGDARGDHRGGQDNNAVGLASHIQSLAGKGWEGVRWLRWPSQHKRRASLLDFDR